jgi:hypothetical protein
MRVTKIAILLEMDELASGQGGDVRFTPESGLFLRLCLRRKPFRIFLTSENLPG